MGAITELTVNCFKKINCVRIIARKSIAGNILHCSTDHSKFLNPFPTSEEVCCKTADLSRKELSKLCSLSNEDDKLSSIVKEINEARLRKRSPEILKFLHLHELYSLGTRSQRFKYLHYLFKREKVKESDKRKEEEKRKLKESLKNEKISNFNCDITRYGLGHNTLLLNIRKPSIHKFYNIRLANSVLFGNKIVIDLNYDNVMVVKEKKSCAFQLQDLFCVNRKNLNPFDLYFCNAKSDFRCVQYLKKAVSSIEKSLVTFYEGSYLDIFPKESLVYLSPHAEKSLEVFDHTAIYIIGGYVDIVKKEKISFKKASDEGIKSYSLPLDDHIHWKQGSKSLTINQVFEILLTLKNTANWKKSIYVDTIKKNTKCKITRGRK